jgi:hypothetical protein
MDNAMVERVALIVGDKLGGHEGLGEVYRRNGDVRWAQSVEIARAALQSLGYAEMERENARLRADREAILELIDGSIERWTLRGGDPKYMEGYEVGVCDACTFLAEDLRRGPPYPSSALRGDQEQGEG